MLSDGLLAADFESAALRARMYASIASHAGTHVVRVRFTGTPVEFIFAVYPHPGNARGRFTFRQSRDGLSRRVGEYA